MCLIFNSLRCVGCMACKFDGVKLLTLDVNRGRGYRLESFGMPNSRC